MDRLTLVQLIETAKARLSPEASGIWGGFEASVYGGARPVRPIKPEELAFLEDRLKSLPPQEQLDVRVVSELRLGLEQSDLLEGRGVNGEMSRNNAALAAAALKDKSEGRNRSTAMSADEAVHRLREPEA